MPMEWNLLVQITGFQTLQSRPLDNFKNPLRNILGCILSNLAGLPGPAEPNFSKRSRISIDYRVSFEFLFWPFLAAGHSVKMEKRSKLLNPRAAACHRVARIIKKVVLSVNLFY